MQGDRRSHDDFAARQAAQTRQSTLAGRDRTGGRREQIGKSQPPPRFGEGVGQVEHARDLELWRQTVAVIRWCCDQRGFRQVDRPALARRRPLHAGSLADGRIQIDESGINHQAFAVDRFGVVGHRHLFRQADGLNDPAPDDNGAGLDRFPRSGHDLGIGNGIRGGVNAGAQARLVVGRHGGPCRRQAQQTRDAQ